MTEPATAARLRSPVSSPAALAGFVASAALPSAAAAQAATAAEEASGDVPADAVERLLEVLRDDAARAALIARLEAEAPPADAEAPAGVARDLAEAAAGLASGAADMAARAGEALRGLSALPGELAASAGEWSGAALALGLTILATVAISLVLGQVSAALARRWNPPVNASVRRRVLATLASAAAYLGAVVIAWLAGYALAAFAFAGPGGLQPSQALYLNAFAAFGLVRVALRLAFSPDADREAALSRLAPGAQAILFSRLKLVAGIVTQGFLFLVPLAGIWLGGQAVGAMRTLVATVAALAALAAIRRIRWATRAARGDRAHAPGTAGRAGAGLAQGAAALWGAVWPPLALVYVAYVWIVAVTRPAALDGEVLRGTAYSLGALIVLAAALALFNGASRLRLPVPRTLARRLPALPDRLATVATAVAWVAGLALGAAAVGLVLEGWGALSVGTLMARPAAQVALWGVVSALLVTLAAALIWAGVDSWIDRRLSADGDAAASARTRTLLALFRNAFAIALGVLALMVALSQLGLDIAPLLAGAGVIGLAVGFGAQKLVQDIITGVFIQLENAMNEGDVVGVAGVTGAVEKITIRSARIRTLDGAAHVVPFSSVDVVSNLTRDFGYHVAEIGAAYKEDTGEVKAAMQEAFDRLSAEEVGQDIIAPLEMHGVTALGDSAVVVRARIKTRAGKHWAVGRRYTELVKQVMDERGLEIPFPHRQIVLPTPLPPAPVRAASQEANGKDGTAA